MWVGDAHMVAISKAAAAMPVVRIAPLTVGMIVATAVVAGGVFVVVTAVVIVLVVVVVVVVVVVTVAVVVLAVAIAIVVAVLLVAVVTVAVLVVLVGIVTEGPIAWELETEAGTVSVVVAVSGAPLLDLRTAEPKVAIAACDHQHRVLEAHIRHTSRKISDAAHACPVRCRDTLCPREVQLLGFGRQLPPQLTVGRRPPWEGGGGLGGGDGGGSWGGGGLGGLVGGGV